MRFSQFRIAFAGICYFCILKYIGRYLHTHICKGEVGKIVFKITVDNEGQILSVRVQSSTLTEATTNIYKKDIKYGAVFRPHRLKGTTIAPTSSGLLTVHVKVRGDTQFIL